LIVSIDKAAKIHYIYIEYNVFRKG